MQFAARMPYFRCDQNADKTCSTSSQWGKLYTCHKQFWFGRRDPSLPTVGQPWIGQPTKDAVAVVIHVFPHWVNHEMRADKRFAGRPHACLPTVSQQCARLVRLTTSMRPDANSAHCSRQPLNALWYLASICSRTSHDRCCHSASTLRRLSFSIAMTAKLLRLIALISSNSGVNRSRSMTNVCTNLNALVVRSSSMSLPMSWSFSASYMASSLALSLASIPGNTIEIFLDTQTSRFQTGYSGFQSFNQINFYNALNINQRDRHQATFVCNTSLFVVHSLVCQHTTINKPRSADIRQHFLATQSQLLHLMTLPVQSFPKYVNRTQCDWDWAPCTLRQAIVGFTARSNVICLACLSTLNQQCRQPKQQIRKLAYRLYTLACSIASQISAKAGLFHGQTLPSSTTGTWR